MRPDKITIVALLSPFFTLILLFSYYPIGRLFGILVATSSPSSLSWEIPVSILDADVIKSTCLTSFFMAVRIFIGIPIGIIFAKLLERDIWYVSICRLLLVLPSFISIVTLSVGLYFLFDNEIGLTNLVGASLGLERRNWLTDISTAPSIMLAFSIWRDEGLVILIILSGLRAIPEDILEAASLDGSSKFQTFIYVILPLLKRPIEYAGIFSIYMSMQFVTPVIQITKGGPQNSTAILPYLIYQEAFEFFDPGRAAVASVALLFDSIIISFLYIILLKIIFGAR